MIDLHKLEQLSFQREGARLSPSALRQIHAELTAARALRPPCGACFGLPGGKPL